MLLHMIEAWVNDDADGRKGIYIFGDREQAVDRVSFDFLLTSMKALGFGPKFIEAVKMMYDTEAPSTQGADAGITPTRRQHLCPNRA